MKKLLILTAFLLAGYFSQANRLLVRSNGAGFAYTSIGEAIDSAQVGDTIVIFPRTDGQQWSLTKTLTKPMAFLNGDTSGNTLWINGMFSVVDGRIIGDYVFKKLMIYLQNGSKNRIFLIEGEYSIGGNFYFMYNSQINFLGWDNLSDFAIHQCRVSLPESKSFKNGMITGSSIVFNSVQYDHNFSLENIKMFSSVLTQNQTGYGNVNIGIKDSKFINNTVISTKSIIAYLSSEKQENIFTSNYVAGNFISFGLSSTLSEGNYFKTVTDPNVRNTLLANGFKQAPANIQLDSIGRIVGNALVDSGATTPWLRDVDGSPADVGITGGPFPIQNYIHPNPGNAQIIHVNIPNRVGYPNRPIPIKATGTSK